MNAKEAHKHTEDVVNKMLAEEDAYVLKVVDKIKQDIEARIAHGYFYCFFRHGIPTVDVPEQMVDKVRPLVFKLLEKDGFRIKFGRPGVEKPDEIPYTHGQFMISW